VVFSSTALIDRINDAQCKVVVTADGGWRRGNEVKLKPAVDEALKQTPSVKIVHRCAPHRKPDSHGVGPGPLVADLIETVNANSTPEELDSEHPLFILYTSGTTGKRRDSAHYGWLPFANPRHHQMDFRH